MADNYIFFPRGNRLTMTPNGRNLPNKYHNWHFDDAPYCKQTRPNQIKVPFAEKAQKTDPFMLFLAYSLGATVTVSIYNVDGTLVEVLAPQATVGYIYSYIDDDGTEYPAWPDYYAWYFDGYTDGHYFVVAHVVYPDDSEEYYSSEPIWVRTTHKNTVYLRWSNEVDAFNIMFRSMGLYFGMRLDSDFMSFEPASDDVVFSDVDDNVRSLYSNPYRVFKLQIGGIRGVPEYVIDKINRALSCTNFTVDDKRYLKQDGSNLEVQKWENRPLQFATIALREYYNDAAGTYINTAPAKLFTRGATFPYFITNWNMKDRKSGNQIWGGLFEFIEATGVDYVDEEYYKDFYNDVIVPMQDLKGEFQWDGDDFVYVSGVGESFYTDMEARVLTIYWEATVSVTNATVPFGYNYSGKDIQVAVWGDGSSTLVTEPGHNSFGNPIMANIYHQYATTGDKTLRIYTSDKTTVFETRAQVNMITAINDSTFVAKTMQRFTISGHDLDGEPFSMAPLSRAKDELRLLDVSYSNISGLVADWATDYIVGTVKPWKLLRYFYLNNNVLDAAAVDAVCNELVISDYGYNGGSGQLRLQSQTPLTAPTGASATARANLTAKFWSQSY